MLEPSQVRSPLEAAAKTITGPLRATIRMCGFAAAAAGRGEGGGEGLRLGDEILRDCLGKRRKYTCVSGFLVKNVNKSRSWKEEEEEEEQSQMGTTSPHKQTSLCVLLPFKSCGSHRQYLCPAFITLCSSAPLPLSFFCAHFVWRTPSAPHDNFFLFLFPCLKCVSSGFSATSHFLVFCFALFFREMREKSETRRR